jgi:hypothetical protein
MKYARVIDSKGQFLIDPLTGRQLMVNSDQFKTGDDAKSYLEKIESKGQETGLSYCCSHGQCKSSIHFRKEAKMVSGQKSRGWGQTWVSDNIKDHVSGCPGPQERSNDHIPHNGYSIEEAASNPEEFILLHLNIDLGVKNSQSSFNRCSDQKTEVDQWRQRQAESHSYFSITSLTELSDFLSKAMRSSQGAYNAYGPVLNRVKIAHEGKPTDLKKFIIRNNVDDRLQLQQDLQRKAMCRSQIRSRHSITHTGGQWIKGSPHLLFFESANTLEFMNHPKNRDRARGRRYQSEEGTIFDQLFLRNTGLQVNDLFPKGALVLAVPFIHQDSKASVIGWDIRSAGNIDLEPNAEVTKLLCWKGQYIPPQRPTQMRLEI